MELFKFFKVESRFFDICNSKIVNAEHIQVCKYQHGLFRTLLKYYNCLNFVKTCKLQFRKSTILNFSV